MILKASQRAGAGQLAAHLLNTKDNEHVRVHELRGFVADDLHGAFSEAHAVSKGTKCRQFLFSLSLNPPKEAKVSEAVFERAADRAEKALGLDGQPRAIVFHEKEGRRHAHVVWSRIDASTMRAVNLPHFKRKLTSLSRELFLDHGWKLPDGMRAGGGKSPLNFTLTEWQQAKREGVGPREIKAVFREAWERSDSGSALAAALAERGYFLAEGDQRNVVAVDTNGTIYSFARYAGVKVREARAKLGEAETLPSVGDVRRDIARLVTVQLKSFVGQIKEKHERERESLRQEVEAMRKAHAIERLRLTEKQAERWALETQERADRMRAGLRGLWDGITGRARAIRQLNEQDAIETLRRDRVQRDGLVHAQLAERAPVQRRVETLRARHAHERRILAREIASSLLRRRAPEPEPPPPPRNRRRGFSLDL